MAHKYCRAGQRFFTSFVNEEVKLVGLSRQSKPNAKRIKSAKEHLKSAKEIYNDHADDCNVCTHH